MKLLPENSGTETVPRFGYEELYEKQRTAFGRLESEPSGTAFILECVPLVSQELTARLTGHARNLSCSAIGPVQTPPSWQPSEPEGFSSWLSLVEHSCSRSAEDIFDLRRDAVSMFISALQAAAENEGTRSPRLGIVWSIGSQLTESKRKDLLDKLGSFSRLVQGWDGYDAPPPAKVAIKSATLFLSQLTTSKLVPNRIKPSVVGGIGITFKTAERKCYVEFYNNGTVYALFSDSEGEPQAIQVRPSSRDYSILATDIRKYLDA